MIEIAETQFIDSGSVIPLDNLIEQYRINGKDHYKNMWDKMKWSDGHICRLINWGV
ncbi:MAG: hypothetical protein LBK73_01430 [Treponema sp.]|jgi:hypothetical protein|nr:hypothetical protein [Treponema sp.]